MSDVATEIGEMSEAIRLYKNDPNYSRTEKRRIKELLDENRNLRNRIIELEKNALDHSHGSNPFKYDDENQDIYG